MISIKCSVAVIFLFYLTFAALAENEITKSPCPDIFSYHFDGRAWFGLLKLSTPSADEAQLKIIFAQEKGVEVSMIYNKSFGGRFGDQIPPLV